MESPTRPARQVPGRGPPRASSAAVGAGQGAASAYAARGEAAGAFAVGVTHVAVSLERAARAGAEVVAVHAVGACRAARGSWRRRALGVAAPCALGAHRRREATPAHALRCQVGYAGAAGLALHWAPDAASRNTLLRRPTGLPRPARIAHPRREVAAGLAAHALVVAAWPAPPAATLRGAGAHHRAGRHRRPAAPRSPSVRGESSAPQLGVCRALRAA